MLASFPSRSCSLATAYWDGPDAEERYLVTNRCYAVLTVISR